MEQGTDWWKNSVCYELYVEKFAGNFRGLMDHIDYLNFLGVDCVHLLPFMPSPMIDDGYDISDYRNVRSDLGTLADFDEFSKRAHAAGIRIMIDLVLNHASTRHPWFLEAKSSRDNQRRDYFLWSETGKEYPDARNPFAHLKPKNWIYNEATKDYYFTTFYPEQADLNWDNPKVFKEMMDIVDFWVARGVEGFRLDGVPYLVKREGTSCRHLPETHAILKKIRVHLDAHYPHVALLAEVHSSLDTIKTYFGVGDECHMVYHFPLTEKILFALKRNEPALVRYMVEASRDIPASCAWAVFLRNHDEISLATLTDEERAEMLPFLDPENKYGFNDKGASVRFATVFKGDEEKMREAFRILLSIPGSPVIYYGEEIGMENEPLPESEHDTRRAVRGAFDWDRERREERDPNSLLSHVVRMVMEKKDMTTPLSTTTK